MRRPLLAVLALLAVGLPARAADETDPGRLFKEGRAAYKAGDFPAAARAFEAANRLAPRGATLYNAALSWLAANDRPRAADDLDQALQLEDFEKSLEVDARERLAALQKQLGTISITEPVGGTATVAHVEDAAIPVRVHLEPGQYDISFHGPRGESGKHPLRALAGEHLTVELAAPAPVAPPPAVTVIRQPEPDRRLGRAWGWGALGVTVACASVSTYLGVTALSARDSFNQSGNTDVSAHDRAATLRTATNVGWAVTAVAAAGSAWLLFRPLPKSTAGEVTAAVSPTAASIRVAF